MALANEEYTVGWITALGVELATAKSTLDEPLHANLHRVPSDNNLYTLGRIGQHNVVVAVLPSSSIGNVHAAHVSANMIRSFPNIKLILMVGVAGGVSSLDQSPVNDVRLGDVFVSDPEGVHGGVVHYDFGTALEDGFKRKGHLNRLPVAIRNVLQHFQADTLKRPYDFMTYYVDMVERNPYMKKNYSRPVVDQLFAAECRHIGSTNDCSGCDTSGLVQRMPRETLKPLVHYGTIGSGSKIVRDAALRDRLFKEEGVRCFEMEASGIMDYVDCLVIRGICDYCDSHKNKSWQPYASAIASAFAREFLLYMPVQIIQEIPHLKVLEKVERGIDELAGDFSALRADFLSVDLRQAINWLRSPDTESSYRTALELREPGTGTWLINSPEYLAWKQNNNRHFWLYGKAGCGKTVLSATINEDLRALCKSRASIGHAMFYFSFSDVQKQSWLDCLRSLVAQMSRQKPTSKLLLQLYQEQKHSQATESALQKIVLAQIQTYDTFFLSLDALDELNGISNALNGTRDTVNKVLEKIKQFLEKAPNTKSLVTSRFLDDIEDCLHAYGNFSNVAISTLINQDIKAYVLGQLQRDLRLRKLEASLREKIVNVLLDKADGMFRWAYCQMDALITLPSTRPDHIELTLSTLPKSLDETYDRMLGNVHAIVQNDVLKLLRWLAFAQRPLTLGELCEVTTIDLENTTLSINPARRNSLDDVQRILQGFVVLMEEAADVTGQTDDKNRLRKSHSNRRIRLAHFSVKEYLVSNRILDGMAKSFHLKEDREQQYLCNSCITYLNYYAHDFVTSKTYTAMSNPENESSMLGRYTGRKIRKQHLLALPLLDYAIEFWHTHLREDEDMTTVISFLGSSMAIKCWIFHCPSKHTEKVFWIPPTTNGLFFACLFGLDRVVKALITSGEDLNPSGHPYGYWYGSALEAAGDYNHKNVFTQLIVAGAKITWKGRHNDTALVIAAIHGRADVVDVLLERGAKVDLIDQHRTALWAASEQGHTGIAGNLLRKGANVNQDCGIHGSPLIVAASCGQVELVKLLLNYGAEVNQDGGYEGDALVRAIRRGDEDIVRVLIAAGALVRTSGSVDYPGTVSSAVQGGHEKIFEMLIQSGAEMSREDMRAFLPAVIRGGHNRILKILIEQGVDINTKIEEDHRSTSYAIILAANTCNEGATRLLLAHGADITVQTESYDTAIHAAVHGGNLYIVKMFMRARADIGAHGSGKYDGILQIAALEGHVNLIRVLIENYGYEVDANAGFHGQALQAAAYSNHYEAARMLIEDYRADVNAQGGWHGNALIAAANSGSLEIIDLLMHHNADITAVGRGYKNALQAAASRGHAQAVERLLHLGFNKGIGDTDLNAAFGHAAAEGHTDVAAILLANGARLYASQGGHQNVLHIAAYRGQNDMIEFLLRTEAENQRTTFRDAIHSSDVIHIAALGGYSETIKLLVGYYDADVNNRDTELNTPLHMAAGQGRLRATNFLIAHGSDVNAVNAAGRRPLHQAATSSKEFDAGIEALLNAGAEIDAVTPDGTTALMVASLNGHLSAVVTLLTAHADLHVKDKHGRTALRLAMSKGHKNVIPWL